MAGRVVAVGGAIVLDSAGLSGLAEGDPRIIAYAHTARLRRGRVLVSASTVTELIRGGRRDAAVYRVLKRISVVDITSELAAHAGGLLGSAGMDGRRHAFYALVATVALRQPRPVLLLTSDVQDMTRLVEEHGRPKDERVVVVHV